MREYIFKHKATFSKQKTWKKNYGETKIELLRLVRTPMSWKNQGNFFLILSSSSLSLLSSSTLYSFWFLLLIFYFSALMWCAAAEGVIGVELNKVKVSLEALITYGKWALGEGFWRILWLQIFSGSVLISGYLICV